MKNKNKHTKGFSLLEAVIALAIWMVLSLSVFLAWQHVSERSNALLARQNAFENARVSLDSLIVNIEIANSITLEIGRNYTLRQLTLWQRDLNGNARNYNFHFDASLRQSAPSFQHLRFGNQELASGIAQITIVPINDRRLHITITTGCEYPVILENSVDIRYKTLTVVRVGW